MRVVLMNSAMMPTCGNYQRRDIFPAEFARIMREASEIVSYVGYQNTADIIEKISGISVPISREQTVLREGDIILVAKLKYRVNPGEKAGNKHGTDVKEYEFCLVRFTRQLK